MNDGASTSLLLGLPAANHSSDRLGLTSVCSANPTVLSTALARAAQAGVACVESTSGQVNQEGGYTGLTPAGFRDHVLATAAAEGLPPERLILGGDHLGPHPWRHLTAMEAMTRAHELVRACVLAGYAKIHLDASMPCADDPGEEAGSLAAEVAAARTAALCATAEAAHAERGAAPAPVYVIGTEVPAPGGQAADLDEAQVTRVADLQATLELSRQAFAARALDAAWERVVAVVVQPGVEFGDHGVVDYEPSAAAELSAYLRTLPHLVSEAHSTDYQRPAALRALVEDGYAILKVGPRLTYAFREAVFALELIEGELLGRSERRSGVREALDTAMLAMPGHWRPYYAGDEDESALARAFSYSDRCRYYWPQPAVRQALSRLLANLRTQAIPASLLSQYLPDAYWAVRDGRLAAEPAALLRHHVGLVLDEYAAACAPRAAADV